MIASVVLHASVAVGLVASVGGHSRASTGAFVATLDVDVDTVEAPLLTPIAPVEPPAPARVEEAQPLPTHTHSYPVDPSHDAHPHDPSLHHDEAVPHHDDDHEHPPALAASGEPAAAAPALVADGNALPHFNLAVGTGAPTGAHVAANGAGNGAAVGASSGASEDPIVPAASVQVAARLVHSVTAAYPSHARADDVEGDVAVEIVIDRDGRVVDARLMRPAGHGFDDAALAAVRAYRFSPAQREGHAVRVRMPWTVSFRLR